MYGQYTDYIQTLTGYTPTTPNTPSSPGTRASCRQQPRGRGCLKGGALVVAWPTTDTDDRPPTPDQLPHTDYRPADTDTATHHTSHTPTTDQLPHTATDQPPTSYRHCYRHYYRHCYHRLPTTDHLPIPIPISI